MKSQWLDGTGILCPKCGCDTEVLETRRNVKSLRRRRKCVNAACDGRVTTVEIIVSDARVKGRHTNDLVLMPRAQVAKLVEFVRDLDIAEDA